MPERTLLLRVGLMLLVLALAACGRHRAPPDPNDPNLLPNGLMRQNMDETS